ncbi:MAG: glycoside hydrolase family 5 protein [Acidobacteriaceae bacterium]
MGSTRRNFLKQAATASAWMTLGSYPMLAGRNLELRNGSAPQTASSSSEPSSLAFSRANNLRRGINASMWFAQSSDYSPQRLATYTTPQDIALIAAMGFDHVRLSIDAAPLLGWQRARPEGVSFMTALDRAIATILQNHLSVIVDIHPESSYKALLFEGTASVENFTELWSALATHFASTDPQRVFFEIMNEPEQTDPYRWQGIESTVAAAIREVAANHTIIAAGAHWSGLQDLLVLEPLALSNIIYTFHDYEPFPFTHQGATWADPRVRPLHAIPYPSSPQDIAPKLNEEPGLAAQFFLDQYGLDQWNAARVENTIGYAARWSKLHGAPVYCGEFGVLRTFAPPAMRAQWLHDMRTSLEKNNVGWAMWDYQASFGVVSKANGVTTPDADVLRALGLHMPGH